MAAESPGSALFAPPNTSAIYPPGTAAISPPASPSEAEQGGKVLLLLVKRNHQPMMWHRLLSA